MDRSTGWSMWHLSRSERRHISCESRQRRGHNGACAPLHRHFIRKERDVKEIGVLTYYIGQKYIVLQKLRETESGKGWERGEPVKIDISTVDAYQGQECKTVLLDIVVAHIGSGSEILPQIIYASLDNVENTYFFSYKYIHRQIFSSLYIHKSAHVRDAHRLCCALTRAKDCLVVFMQLSLLLNSAKMAQYKKQAATSDFARDAFDRGLVSIDDRHIDTSEEGIAARKRWSTRQTDTNLRNQRIEQDRAIQHNLTVARQYDLGNAGVDNAPKPQTPARKTA